MVTSRWTMLENNLFKLAQEEAHPNRALFLHSCFQARGTVSSRNISSRAVRAVCRMVKHSLQVSKLERWRTWVTRAREKQILVPINLQFMPLHYSEGDNHPTARQYSNLNSQLPFRRACLMQQNLCFFCTCYLGLLIFLFQNHLIVVWWF